MISVIVAHTNNFVIGKDGGMPWHLPADLAYFKKVTMSHPVIMGRKTFESIGRALPGRTNIVISRNKIELPEGVLLANSIEQAIAFVDKETECFVIGGGSIYKDVIKYADRLYITKIHAEIEGDTTFPAYDVNDYQIIASEERAKDEKNSFDLSFIVYEKKTV
jgi:dihydrofolate reductase